MKREMKTLGLATRLFAEGRYVIKGSPRRGGIAAVYRAHDLLEDRRVALKLFKPVHDRHDVIEESFRRETQALLHLRHPHIVEIFDSGTDEETGEHYITMEWIENDADMLRAGSPPENWEHIYKSVGRPVLEALAFAHTHAIVHRAIKPSNILITSEGVAKVCDFGISKIRNFLEPGVTLAQYASIPYAPPEPDDGTYSFTRDVFGFAALCVALLAPQAPKDHRELLEMLDALDIEEPIRRLLQRCLSLDAPSDRPANAAVLLGDFDRLAPRAKIVKQGIIIVFLTQKVKDILNHDLGIADENMAKNFIESDRTDARVVVDPGEPKPMPDGGPPMGRAVRLFGNKYGYIGVINAPAGDKLRLVSALEYMTSQIEEYREGALEPAYAFNTSGVTLASSAQSIKQLQEALVEFEADQKAALVARRGQAIYNTWLNLLNAKSELEHQRKHRIGYSQRELLGSIIHFVLFDGADSSVLDEQDIRVEVSGDLEFAGTVVSVSEDGVRVIPNDRNRADPRDLPDSATLNVDTTKADAAIEKQRAALDAVRIWTICQSLSGYIHRNSGRCAGRTPSYVDFCSGGD